VAWIGSQLLWEGLIIASAHLGLGLPLPEAPAAPIRA